MADQAAGLRRLISRDFVRVIALTSAQPGAGVSFVTRQLAAAATALGREVCVPCGIRSVAIPTVWRWNWNHVGTAPKLRYWTFQARRTIARSTSPDARWTSFCCLKQLRRNYKEPTF